MEKFKIPKSFLVLMWNVSLDAAVSWMQNSLTVTWGVWKHLPSRVEVGGKSVFTVREYITDQSVDMKSMLLKQERKQEKESCIFCGISIKGGHRGTYVGLGNYCHKQNKMIYHLLSAHSVSKMT